MKLIVIPDVQAKPSDDFTFLTWIGKYIAEEKPDVIVQIGDFADMESLCEYDKGKKSFEGRSYKKDIEAARKAMACLMAPILFKQARLELGKRKKWKPRMILTLGNHENRINRAVELDRKLEDLISIDDLDYKSYGWEVYPFLKTVSIEDTAFCHYMCSGTMGRPVGTAKLLCDKMHMSTIVGHQQGRDISFSKRADGKNITCIIAGSCFSHQEPYLNSQTNNHWRGIVQLNNVCDGEFEEEFISLRKLEDMYRVNI